MSLYQSFRLFRDIPRSGAGYFALGGKVTKTPPGTPRTPICPIGRYQGRHPVATEFLLGLRPPRNRSVSVPLRLSPLGLRVISFLLAGACAGSNRRMEFDTKLDGSIPLTGRQPKSDQIPAADQMPKGRGSVAAQYQTRSRPIGQTRGAGVSPAVFSPICGRPKMGPPEAKQPEGLKKETFRGPIF